MLIGFTGAGGTGKTTTARALAAATGLPFIPSPARTVFARRGLVEADQAHMTPGEQLQLEIDIFQEREKLEATLTDGIADRTLMDQLTYTLLRAHPVLHRPLYEDLLQRARAAISRYDYIVYFPLVDLPGDEDGFRHVVYGSRLVFDMVLRRLLTGHDHVMLGMDTVEHRVDYLRNLIEM